MNLEHTTLRMNERERASGLILRTYHRRHNACLNQSGFDQAIKVGCDNDFDEPLGGHLRDCAVGCGRLLLSFLTFLFISPRYRVEEVAAARSAFFVSWSSS